MREGLELLHEQQVHNNMRLFHVLLAEAEAELGRLEVGLATLSAEHEAIERTGERWFHAEVHRVRGELLLRRQPPDVSAAESAFMRARATKLLLFLPPAIPCDYAHATSADCGRAWRRGRLSSISYSRTHEDCRQPADDDRMQEQEQITSTLRMRST